MKEPNCAISVTGYIAKIGTAVRDGCDQAHQRAVKLADLEQHSPLGGPSEITLWLDASGSVAKNKNEAVCEVRFSTFI